MLRLLPRADHWTPLFPLRSETAILKLKKKKPGEQQAVCFLLGRRGLGIPTRVTVVLAHPTDKCSIMASSLETDVLKDVAESDVKGAPEEEPVDEQQPDSSDEEEKMKTDSPEEESNEEGYDDEEEEKEKSLIVEGKREKKKVERLSLEMSVQKKEEEVVEGKGVKLADIERVQYFMKKRKSEELRVLHRLLFNRLGTIHFLKKNISQFSGFPFEKDSDHYKKKEEMLKKCKKVMLKIICEVLDLERSGSNGELITRILSFLMEPKPSGKPLPKSAKKTTPSKGGKKERSSSGSSKKKQPKDKKSNVILSDESSSEEEKKEDTSDEEKESEEEEEEPPKKKARKEKPKRKSTPKTPKGKKNVKSAHVKKADSSTTKKNQQANSKKEEVPESESETDSSDDEPLIKKVKKPPTDDELKETVKKLLASANLEEVTMKQICKKVNESYPNDDLTSRKDFIKAAVKELIS
ncbi:protein DEK isoform X1 [Ambystoma mexicanum]|uniref:protein DEK isoform X1 n=2 Tax=Ambystoma mexicanum TaxID=8296 RepID=UPI0037E6FC62